VRGRQVGNVAYGERINERKCAVGKPRQVEGNPQNNGQAGGGGNETGNVVR